MFASHIANNFYNILIIKLFRYNPPSKIMNSKVRQAKNRVIFLGTGGGKNVMARQAMRTGGIFIELKTKDDIKSSNTSVRFIIDPGPGSLVHAASKKMEPENWDGVLLSHLHPDHSTDANAIIDCIAANKKKPFLAAEEHCLKPKDDYYPCISKFHQKVSDVFAMKANRKISINGLKITAVRSDHYVPTIGFIIKSQSCRIGYASDGTYYKGQEKNFEGCDLLILNVLVPKGEAAKKKWHMSVDEAIELVSKIKKKPRLLIIQHFSFWMLRANVYAQAEIIEKATGVKTMAAGDFMEVDLNKFYR